MLLEKFEKIVLPPVCVVCDGNARRIDICDDCVRALPWNRSCCARCAAPLSAHTACGACLAGPPPWHAAQCPLLYDFPVQSLLQRFKFARRLAVGRVLAMLFVDWFASTAATRPDCLVPVPLHWRRRLGRQFNQASEIAHVMSAGLELPVTEACRRTRNTAPQSSLVARERRRNLRGAFRVVKPIDGMHVAIVDDILTTGSTAAEMTQILYEHGAHRVDVWALARA